MHWSFIVLIIVMVSLVLGPVLMLKPRPAQQRREALRLRARELGLGFGLRVPPGLKTDMEPPSAMPCYFIAPKNIGAETVSWGVHKTSYTHEANFYQDWDWLDNHRPSANVQAILRQAIMSFPAGVKAITCGPGGVSLFWDERDGEDFLTQLLQLLTDIQQA